MAGYRQHISVSGMLGAGYGTAAVYLFGFRQGAVHVKEDRANVHVHTVHSGDAANTDG